MSYNLPAKAATFAGIWRTVFAYFPVVFARLGEPPKHYYAGGGGMVGVFQDGYFMV